MGAGVFHLYGSKPSMCDGMQNLDCVDIHIHFNKQCTESAPRVQLHEHATALHIISFGMQAKHSSAQNWVLTTS